MNLYTFRRFRKLPDEAQIHELSLHGESLDLACSTGETEVVLFAYHDFYVELEVRATTDEILSISSFRSVKKLAPYLHQVDISEINVLLACG